jgi:hypothetical protein
MEIAVNALSGSGEVGYLLVFRGPRAIRSLTGS